VSKAVGVSSITGEGFDDFMQAVEQAKEEYYRWLIIPPFPSPRLSQYMNCRDYVPETERIVKNKEAKLEEMKKEHMERAMKDIRLDERGGGGGEGWEEGDGDDEEEEGDFDMESEFIHRTRYFYDIDVTSHDRRRAR
jgi:GPN-loop GTPase